MKRLIASHALAGTAVAMPWPALLATIWHESGDAASLGVAGAARYLPCVLLSAVLGGLGDRFGRFWTVRTVTAVRVLSLCVVAALMASGATWAALVMATLTVAAGVPAFPSLAALVPTVSPHPDRATDTLVTCEISAFVVGPALGGLMLAFGPAVSVAACVPLIVAALLVLPRRVDEPVFAKGPVRLAGAVHQVLRVPQVRRAIVAVMMLNAVLGALGVALLSITELHWRASVTQFGWATAVLGFASLAAPLLLVALRRVRPAVAAQGAVVLPLLCVAVSPTWVAGVLPLALLGAGLTVVECQTTRMLQRWAPARFTAVALGVADAALVGAALAGAVAAPLLVQALGPAGLLVALAVLSALVLGWGLSGRRRRGIADDRGLQNETQPTVGRDGRQPVVLHGQVDVVLLGRGEDPATDGGQQPDAGAGSASGRRDRDEVEIPGAVRLHAT